MSEARAFVSSLGGFRTEVRQSEDGHWHATSPDLKGFLVTQPTLPELRRQIPDALYSMLLAVQTELAAAVKERDAFERQLEGAKANEGMADHYAGKANESLTKLLKITPHTHDCPDDESCPVVDAQRTVAAHRR